MKKIKSQHSCRGGITTNIATFKAISGCPLTYWISEQMINVFAKSKQLSAFAEPRQGLATADNNRFLRLWHEVLISKSCFNATDHIHAFYTGMKWFPYNKGGENRKWYGNNDFLINYETDGKELKAFEKSVIRNPNYYFRQAITWSKISGRRIAFRYKPQGHIFDVAGTSIFTDDEEIFNYLLGLLNTKLMQYLLDATSPTINYEVGQIANLPIIIKNKQKEMVIKLTISNVDLSKKEWDEFEVSWNFRKHPLI